jgi:hypothetical protein
MIKFAADFILATHRGETLANSCIIFESKSLAHKLSQAFLTSNGCVQ